MEHLVEPLHKRISRMIYHVEPKLISNYDHKRYMYGYCRCSMRNYGIEIPKDARRKTYVFICKNCGTKGTIFDASRNCVGGYRRRFKGGEQKWTGQREF